MNIFLFNGPQKAHKPIFPALLRKWNVTSGNWRHHIMSWQENPLTRKSHRTNCCFHRRFSLRSWRYCKRPRNKVLAAEPTSERRSREENGERDSESGFAARSRALRARISRLRRSCARLDKNRHATQAIEGFSLPFLALVLRSTAQA